MIPLIFFRIPTKPCPDSIHCSRYFKRVFFIRWNPTTPSCSSAWHGCSPGWSVIRPFNMQNSCTKLKANKPCYWLAGFVYLLLANNRVFLPFVNQQQGLFTSSLVHGLYVSKGRIVAYMIVVALWVADLNYYYLFRCCILK